MPTSNPSRSPQPPLVIPASPHPSFLRRQESRGAGKRGVPTTGHISPTQPPPPSIPADAGIQGRVACQPPTLLDLPSPQTSFLPSLPSFLRRQESRGAGKRGAPITAHISPTQQPPISIPADAGIQGHGARQPPTPLDHPSPHPSFLRRQESRGAGKRGDPTTSHINPTQPPPPSIPADAGIQGRVACQPPTLLDLPSPQTSFLPSLPSFLRRQESRGAGKRGAPITAHISPTQQPPISIPADAGIQGHGARQPPTPLDHPSPHPSFLRRQESRGAGKRGIPTTSHISPTQPRPLSIPADAGIQGRGACQPPTALALPSPHPSFLPPPHVIPAEAGIQR